MISAIKHPLAVEDFVFDLASLAGTSAVVSVAYIVEKSGLTLQDMGAVLPLVKLRIGGGTVGSTYTIVFLATLTSGDVRAFSCVLNISLPSIQLNKLKLDAQTFTVLWDPQIAAGDSIADSSWVTSSALTLIAPFFTTYSASVVIGAGSVGINRATNVVVLASGQVLATDILVYVS